MIKISKILIFVFFFSLLSTLINFTYAQINFNPFRFGIKTVKEVKEIIDDNFRNKVREKAAEFLNQTYATSGLFEVSGERIISNDPNISVNEAVRQNYGSWYILLVRAADEVIQTDQVERERLAKILNISQDEVLNLEVLNVSINNEAVLEKIFVGPSRQQGSLPSIQYCEQGIGQCALWFLTYLLRFFYSLALFLGVIFLIWAGILYITSPGKSSEIHSRFYFGLLGIIVAVLSFSFVKALETGLSTGGDFMANNQQQNQDQDQNKNRTTSNIYIDPTSIGYWQNNISFVAKTNQGTCNLSVSVYNLRTRQTISSNHDIQTDIQVESFSIGILDHQPGDTLRIYFSSDNCNVNLSQYDVRITQERAEIVIEEPTIEIYGAQTFRINQVNFGNFKEALESIFRNLIEGIAEYALFDPPFYIRFSYEFTNPPINNGRCEIDLAIKAANATNLNFDENNNLVNATWRRFNRSFTFRLPYERNKSQRIEQLQINLPQNTYIQIEYTILNINYCKPDFDLPLTEDITIKH